MSSAATGLLSSVSPDPFQYSFEYRNGQFIAQAVPTNYVGEIFSFIDTPALGDSSTSVDVGIGGADEREIYGFVGCRAGQNDEGYLFLLEPAIGHVALWRQDATGPVLLAEDLFPQYVTAGKNQFNRLQIDCIGNQISASINGVLVISMIDATYADGFSYIGIGNTGGTPDNLFGVFDNLIVVGQSAGSSTTTTTTTTTTDGPIDLATIWNQTVNLVASTEATTGPFAATTTLVDGDLKTMPAGVSVTDFYAEVGFSAPVNAPAGFWSVGLCFWLDAAGNCQNLVIGVDNGNAQWILASQAPDGSMTKLDSGPATGLDLNPGATNFLGVFISGSTGLLTINSYEALDTFNLPQLGSGDVEVQVTFVDDPDTDRRPLNVEIFGFKVWDLAAVTAGSTTTSSFTKSPDVMVAGPLQGALPELADTVQTASAGINLDDFFTTVTFTVPADVSVPWDVMIGFRDTGGNNQFRLTITSTGQWSLAYGANAAFANGTVGNLKTTPGQTNTIDLLVQGTNGAVSLNGADFATLELSASTAAGDVFIATGSSTTTTLVGRNTTYREFQVWSLT